MLWNLIVRGIFALALLTTSVLAQTVGERTFPYQGDALLARDVSDDTVVFFHAMRLNRALNVWNVEVTISNKTADALAGPIFLSIESFANTPGPVNPDGSLFYIFTNAIPPGERAPPRTLSLGRGTASPTMVTKVFGRTTKTFAGAAFVRTLNEVGHPLPNVEVVESGPEGLRTYDSDPVGGFVTLGQGSGLHTWRFSKPGYHPVWRTENLTSNQVLTLAHPRLTPTNAPSLSLQSLPSLLPLGWSPLQAFWADSASIAQVAPVGFIPRGRPTVLARLDQTELKWETIQILTGDGTNALPANVPGFGAYALAVPDSGSPPPVGAILQSINPAIQQSVSAGGAVTPSVGSASRSRDAVTAAAQIIFTNSAGPLPSGTQFRAEIRDSYRLNDGTVRVQPLYDNAVIGYQLPGDNDPATLHAAFPVRPLALFGPEELERATILVDMLQPNPFTGAMLQESGGEIRAGLIRLVAETGDVIGRQAIELRLLDPTNYLSLANGGATNGGVSVPASLTILHAFQVNVAGITPGQELTLAPLPTNAILARVVLQDGLFGIEPAAITKAGQYLIVRLHRPHGTITGTTLPGNAVRIAGQPWLTIADANGIYRLVAPTGAVQVLTTDLSTGDVGQAASVLTEAGTSIDVSSLPSGPRVISISPAHNASNVLRVSSVVIEFSEPINPGTLSIQLLHTGGATNGGASVPASLALNLRNTTASLFPINQLAPSAAFAVALSTDIADTTGLKLEGPNLFTFTTESDRLARGLGGQLISYEPTNGLARMEGTQGIADPDSPVILVNETSGRTSTVLSQPDGSFNGSIEATVDDFLAAVFVNQNGTRNTVPVSRQVFSDGSVALFKGGGTITAEAEHGPVDILVEPGGIDGKTKFKLEPLTLAQMLTLVSNTVPEEGRMLGAFRLGASGDPPKESVDVSFPVDLASLQLPPGVNPEDASYGLAVVQEIDGVTAYRLVDRMQYENGKLVTHSQPFDGLLGAASLLDPLTGRASFLEATFYMLAAPIILSVSGSITVAGKVQAAVIDEAGLLDSNTVQVVRGARVTYSPSSQANRPGRLRPGTVFGSSGPDGSYAMLVPRSLLGGDAVTMRATHPRFPGLVARLPSTLPGFVEGGSIVDDWDLIFGLDGNDNVWPGVIMSHSPLYPVPGTNALLRVVATDDRSLPAIEVALDLEETPGLYVTLQPVNEEDVGGTLKRKVYSVTATNAATVALLATATDGAGHETKQRHFIYFGGTATPPDSPIPPSDSNDNTPPRVVLTVPAAGGRTLASGEPITVRFNEPIDPAILQTPSIFRLEPAAGLPSLALSSDQEQLTLIYYNMAPSVEYALTIPSAIQDLSGNLLDQDPVEDGANGFSFTFKTAALPTGAIQGIESGGGAIIKGAYAFVLERKGAIDGGVIVYDLSDPANPLKVGEFGVPGYPRDFALIPGYSFKRRPDAAIETKDLLAVVGGKLGALQVGQYLWIIDVTTPVAPQRVAAAAINLSASTAVKKILWSAPQLGYLEIGEVPSIGVINLQMFILGLNLTSEEYLQLPAGGNAGLDLNGDGDFVDSGEELPLPDPALRDVAGKIGALVLEDTDQFIIDFDFEDGGQFVGVVLEAGHEVGSGGTVLTNNPVPAAYQTLLKSGLVPDRESAFQFTNGYPSRVSLLARFPITINNRLVELDLALISLQMDGGQTNRLVVLNVTDPTTNTVMAEILIPGASGANIFSAFERDDGKLLLATSRDLVVIDPSRFAERPGTNGAPHPAIVGVIAGAGTGGKVASVGAGLSVASLGSINQVFSSGPALRFIQFAGATNVFNPEGLVNQSEALGELLPSAQGLSALMPGRFRPSSVAALRRVDVHAGAPSTLSPPQAESHYYLLVHAPGGAGASIEIGLESLNRSGAPLKNKGRHFAPVMAVGNTALAAIEQTPVPDCDAPVRSLRAFRLSSDKSNPNYNVYLSKPFALTYERMSLAELAQLKQQLDREILWGGFYLRASLDLSMLPDPVLGAFATDADYGARRLIPGISQVVEAFPGGYLLGPNPPSVAGHVEVPGTFGSVSAHNGEFRTDTEDFVLPGRRLNIAFVRTGIGQDLYDGPFGRFWDFNYNQQLLELRPAVFPGGTRFPLVPRGGEGEDLVGARDVLFQTGEGRNVLFRHVSSSNAPPEIVADPLVTSLGWRDTAANYYLPQQGVFDLLVRFRDGKFARLTPDGTQFWYNSKGRLQTIYDRFPKNKLRFDYNLRDELVQITDESVSAPRYLKIGYWRFNSDPLFVPATDRIATNGFIAGRIARLIDYTQRDVLFFYTDEGLLERREGPEVAPLGDDGFAGRPVTRYVLDEACGTIKGIIAGSEDGTPLLQATVDMSTETPQIKAASGVAGPVEITFEHQNTALAMAAGAGKTIIKAADESFTDILFNAAGLPATITQRGTNVPNSTTTDEYNDDGLVIRSIGPEGDMEEFDYDSTNPAWRSRGNLLRTRRIPGQRGGETLETRFNYDPRYNLASGAQQNANGQFTTHVLSANGAALERIDYPDSGSQTFAYNEYGQPIARRTVEGFEYALEYDSATGFNTREIRGGIPVVHLYEGVDGQRGLATKTVPPMHAPITYSYDALERVTEERRGPRFRRVAYDQNGNAIRVDNSISTNLVLTERRRYDQLGFLRETTTENVEVDGAPTNLVTRYEPDPLQRIKRVIFPGGEIREHQFDQLGRLTSTRTGEIEEHWSYDKIGNLTAVSSGSESNSYVYDGHDRPTEIRRHTALGAELTKMTYFGEGGVKSTIVEDPIAGKIKEDDIEEIDTYGRAKRGRSFSSTHGYVTTEFRYDSAARTITVTGPRGFPETTHYDAAGRTTRKVNALADVSFTYDDNDNLRQVVSTEGTNLYTSTFAFDELDQQIEASDDLGLISRQTLRIDGVPLLIENARGHFFQQDFSMLGEPTLTREPTGVTLSQHYAPHRSISKAFDADGRGKTYCYDASFRLAEVTHRNNTFTRNRAFDPRGQPIDLLIPGGTVTAGYDSQQRLTNQLVTFNALVTAQSIQPDALGRVARAAYNGDSAAFQFDAAGAILAADYNEKGRRHHVATDIYPDGTLKSITYPSGVVVLENRTPDSRLASVVIEGSEPLVQSITYANAEQPGEIIYGTNLFVLRTTYDVRRRPVAMRYVRPSGEILVDIRYAYDAGDNIVVRQLLHRGGRVDLFQYDPGDRLARVDYGARPSLPSVARTLGGFTSPFAALAPGFFAREYTYDTNGLDLLTHSLTINPNALATPFFVTNRHSHDDLLFPIGLDSQTRAPDPLGNTQHHPLRSTIANLVHDGLGHLARITQDGTPIEYASRPDGARYYRRTGTNEETGFIYHNDLLLEERDYLNGANRLIARYYYADRDVPFAVDLENRRYWLLADALGSVVAVLDEAGQIIEQVSYDAWGAPSFELRDTTAPRVTRVESDAEDLLVQFSEAVHPPLDPAASGTPDIVQTYPSLGNTIRFESASGTLAGQLLLDETKQPFGACFRFKPSSPVSPGTPLTLRVGANALNDSWRNSNPAETIPFLYAPSSPLFDVALSTAPAATNRSAINQRILFHGQYFDYETGLLYLRNRYYDPYSGIFLQPDPEGYADSVNPYAAFNHNPVNERDPTGTISVKWLSGLFKRAKPRPIMIYSRKEAIRRARGFHDLEVDAINFARAEFNRRHAKAGKAINAVHVRNPNAFKRIERLDSGDFTQKPGYAGGKSVKDPNDVKRGLVVDKAKNKEWVGDLDLHSIEINGRLAEADEVLEFTAIANRRFAEMWKKSGRRFKGVPPVPFKHGAHLNIPERLGTTLYKAETLTGVVQPGYKNVTVSSLAELGHPGASTAFSWNSAGRGFMSTTPEATTQRLLRDFVNPKLIDLQKRMGHQPIGLKAIDDIITLERLKGNGTWLR